VANGITNLFNMNPEEKEKLGENGKEYVLNNFTYSNLSNKYMNELEKL